MEIYEISILICLIIWFFFIIREYRLNRQQTALIRRGKNTVTKIHFFNPEVLDKISDSRKPGGLMFNNQGVFLIEDRDNDE